jgi:hypothetical protein
MYLGLLDMKEKVKGVEKSPQQQWGDKGIDILSPL